MTTEDTRRSAVLLGAGASKDAGLLLTDQLASEVVRRLNKQETSSSRRPGWLSALNFTYASIASYQSRDGGNPLQGVNIERLISALRLLSDRENHEAAPFVGTWKDPVLPAGRVYTDEHAARQAVESIGQALTGGQGRASSARQATINAGYYLAEIAERAKTPVRSEDYREADRRILSLLGELLQVEASVDYLFPLIDLAESQQDGLDMISLNYDLAIEQAASERGVHVARGVQAWPDSPISFPTDESGLRLHKVHGSLDWQLEESGSPFAAPRLSVHDGISKRPWLVVGDREKLATNGPTLALLRAAQDALERADHLIIVGYGFADMHVNAMIRDWLNRDDERTLGIIDPTWPYPDERTFRGWLLHTYGDSAPNYTHADPAAKHPATGRIQAFQGGARAALPRAVALRTVEDSSTWDITVTHVGFEEGSSDAKVTLKLEGTPLTSVWFSVGRAGPRNVSIIGGESILSKVRTDFPMTITEWLPGEPVVMRIPLASDAGSEITIYGRSLTREIFRTVTAYSS